MYVFVQTVSYIVAKGENPLLFVRYINNSHIPCFCQSQIGFRKQRCVGVSYTLFHARHFPTERDLCIDLIKAFVAVSLNSASILLLDWTVIDPTEFCVGPIMVWAQLFKGNDVVS